MVNFFQRDSSGEEASGWLRLKTGSACRRLSWSSRRRPLTDGGRVPASSARSTSWTSTSSQVTTLQTDYLPSFLMLSIYLSFIFFIAELKTISLKITTVDMKRPPADFRFFLIHSKPFEYLQGFLITSEKLNYTECAVGQDFDDSQCVMWGSVLNYLNWHGSISD